MQVLFYEKEMDKNIEFTKSIYDMNDLDGYTTFFDKFSPTKLRRGRDLKMNIEKFLKRMDKSNLFVSKLFFGRDEYIPIRYSVNARVSKNKDSLLEIHCDLTGENYSRIQSLYHKTYDRWLQDSL